MADSEIDRLDPELTQVTLSTGYTVGIQRLKTRQFFRLLKVLTRGVGPAVVQSGLDFSQDSEAFGQRLLGMTLMAIPEAEQQFIDFLLSMCTPLGMHESRAGARLDKQQTEDNQAAVTEMVEELNNPDLADLIDLAEAIIKQEAPDIQALGKKVAGLLEMAKKTGQLDSKTKTSSPASSPQPSTSSATITDGMTSESSASRSAGSGSASRRRQPAANATS